MESGKTTECFVLEGDYGGQIYAVVPAEMVSDEPVLSECLREIDQIHWNDEQGCALYKMEINPTEGVSGGMGGGGYLGPKEIWFHDSLSPKLCAWVKDRIAGKIIPVDDTMRKEWLETAGNLSNRCRVAALKESGKWDSLSFSEIKTRI